MPLSQRALTPKASTAPVLPASQGGAHRVNQVHERNRGMIRVCHAFTLVLGLHCLTSLLAGAWPQQDGSIIKAVLHPELSFWQGFLPNNPGGSHAAFHTAARRRDSENETAGESHAQKFVHGHPWHASHTKGEAAKRELESVNKRAASEELVLLQDQKEQAAVQMEVQASQGVLAGFLSFLWEDKVTWADRLAEHLNSQNLDAWEERQLAQYQRTQSTIRGDGKSGQFAVSVYAPLDAHARSPDHCAAALQVPKVAFMFLTRGALYHEATWDVWFRGAAGLLPIASLQAAECEPGLLEHLKHSCSVKSGTRVLQQQHLFSVYIHVGANEVGWSGFPEDSMFHGREIAERVHVKWGTFALVEATRALMRAALEDPLNQKFVLLSEAGIPLYPPDTFYMQLMSETKSRINSCVIPGVERDVHRWIWRMETENMRQEHWRKSSQWVTLARKHAQIAVEDREIAEAFGAECQPSWRDGWWRDCYSDEHYFATLLATKNLDEETDCEGQTMHVDWSFGGEHPRSYSVRETTSSRMRQLRQPSLGCSYAEAIMTSAAQFVHVESLSVASCRAARVPYASTLGYQCPLLARKFAPETADHIYSLITDCSSRLNISRISGC
ncbi:probable glycosyltransferase BC10 at C-terminar half [Coccomyxa sp. Obi]|nr:probable glycosyltransferase BC10 at C-terminar half [Coccomyxa sp. Obi]